MKCVIPGGNVKIMAKSIHALAKIGDEMYVKPQKNSISFRTVNMANSAYADLTFYENYFSYYTFEHLEEDDALKCKISMRSVMTVFKAPNTLDKQVETCHIRLEPNASELLFILKYKNSITKTHLLPILDCENLQAAYIKDGVANQLCSQPRVLADIVQNFQQNLIEVTLEVSSQKVLLRNYIDDTSNTCNATRTQLALGTGEFDRYVVNNETAITFCMKEFRAILTFAELVGIPISIHFEAAGSPVVFVLKNSTFEANLVLATLNPDVDSQTETTIIGKQEKLSRRTANRRTVKRSTKASSRIRNITANSKAKIDPNLTKLTHPCFLEEEQRKITHHTTNGDTNDKQSDSIFSTTEILQSKAANSCKDKEQSITAKKLYSTPPSSDELTPSTSRACASNKKLIHSIFSTITKRKSDVNEKNEEQTEDSLDDTVPGSPPRPVKKARIVFKKCFQTTFDPRMLPGHDTVLAEDSDEYNSE